MWLNYIDDAFFSVHSIGFGGGGRKESAQTCNDDKLHSRRIFGERIWRAKIVHHSFTKHFYLDNAVVGHSSKLWSEVLWERVVIRTHSTENRVKIKRNNIVFPCSRRNRRIFQIVQQIHTVNKSRSFDRQLTVLCLRVHVYNECIFYILPPPRDARRTPRILKNRTQYTVGTRA